MLSTSAFNAMLKTLEEPPEHVKFILATTDPQKIPVTVLSRCLQFNLKQMPSRAIAAHLEAILAEEKLPGEGGALRLLAEGARGSMRDALSLLDQAIAYSAGNVTEQAVRAMLGTIDDSFLYSILEGLARGDSAAVLAIAEDMRSRSVGFDGALQDLGALLHRVALAQGAPDAVDAEGGLRERLTALGRALGPEEVQLYYQIAIHGRQDLPFAPDEFAGFTMALLRMLAFSPETRDAGESQRNGTAESEPREGARQAGASQPVAGAEFDGDWPKLANSLDLGGITKQLAQASELGSFDGEALELCVPPAAKHLAERSYQEKLASMEVEGQSGAGMVKVAMTCRHDVKRVNIDPSLLADDKDMLEDLVAAAVNDAARKVEAAVQEKMSALTGGLGLPPGMKLPF